MSYCTQQDMVDRFGELELIQLTDRHDVNAIDTDVLDRAMERGASLIDSYCRVRYQIPLNPVDPMIIDLNADLARYHLYDDSASEQVTKNHDEAMRMLKQISQGVLQLTADGLTGTSSSGSPQFDSGERVFSRDSLKGF